ncbi:hypothetical protein [Cyclobacterium xiamenense]|uniref:hypothetical protein n=1 Tax=Cyclobacterium xiamenense TaxID=1297121 RepID=UPI0035CEB323
MAYNPNSFTFSLVTKNLLLPSPFSQHRYETFRFANPAKKKDCLYGVDIHAVDFARKCPNVSFSERAVSSRPIATPTGKVQAVIDTDTYNEIDDQFAMVYALLSPDQLDVHAIYAAPLLNKRSESPKDGMEKSPEEIGRLLNKLNREQDGFVYQGSESFLTNLNKPRENPAANDLIQRARNSE